MTSSALKSAATWYSAMRNTRNTRGRAVAALRVVVATAVAAMVFVAGTACSSPSDAATRTPPPVDSIPVDTTTPPPSGPVVAECAAPKAEWIWCDDFESDRLSSYFEYGSAGGRFVRAANAGVANSFGMSARYNTTESGAGSLKLAFGRTPSDYVRAVDAGTEVYREIYWRWYILHPSGWTGGGANKMTRAMGLVSADWAQTAIAHVWTGGPANLKLALDPASGTDAAGTVRTTSYNDFDNLRWLGIALSNTDIHDGAHLGKWVCVEAHVRLNDPGQSNGVFALWIDGVAEAQRTGLNWVGAYSTYGINAIFYENYWDNRSPIEQTRFWDNLVVSRGRVGC